MSDDGKKRKKEGAPDDRRAARPGRTHSVVMAFLEALECPPGAKIIGFVAVFEQPMLDAGPGKVIVGAHIAARPGGDVEVLRDKLLAILEQRLLLKDSRRESASLSSLVNEAIGLAATRAWRNRKP